MLETKSDSAESTTSPCRIRPLRREDVMQISQIDREAFPTMWPPVNFVHELENRLAHYLVAYKEVEIVLEPEQAVPERGLSWLTLRFRNLFGTRNHPVYKSSDQYILGFTGLWMLADEAHVINIAVREKYHRQGIGELLLIAGLDLAMKLKASMMTLEVRASNKAAKSLYAKYDFVEVGIRRAYYTDNKEDAILMTTDNLTSADFQAKFQQLKETHLKKLGMTGYEAESDSHSGSQFS